MNIYIKDTLQTIAAVLITCSMVATAAPVPDPVQPPVKVNEEAKTVVVHKKKSTKKVTWRDNPNKCDLKKQYIAKEKPFKCLKKIQAKSVRRVARSSRSAYAPPKGNKAAWLKASGIPSSNWWAVDFIVTRESGWNPCSYNPGKSNCGLTAYEVNCSDGSCQYGGVACGLGQSLACGKWGSNWTDPVNQLKHMNIYVSKYGGWAGAVNYWKSNGHY
jgi:hypothetical protein